MTPRIFVATPGPIQLQSEWALEGQRNRKLGIAFQCRGPRFVSPARASPAWACKRLCFFVELEGPSLLLRKTSASAPPRTSASLLPPLPNIIGSRSRIAVQLYARLAFSLCTRIENSQLRPSRGSKLLVNITRAIAVLDEFCA